MIGPCYTYLTTIRMAALMRADWVMEIEAGLKWGMCVAIVKLKVEKLTSQTN